MVPRRTSTIVTDDPTADAAIEADVIMTAATVGFALEALRNDYPVQFDIDPLDKREKTKVELRDRVVTKLNGVLSAHGPASGRGPFGRVSAGESPRWSEGGVIMGVYRLAGQERPVTLPIPRLSARGEELWHRIRKNTVHQYTESGAYTGFVDNKNTVGHTHPVGPRSTARFLVGEVANADPMPHPRWLPPAESPLWQRRARRNDKNSLVPWGIIGGENAGDAPDDPKLAPNKADETTILMGPGRQGMTFVGDPGPKDIVGYTHGMVQAIYEAYELGPSATPYEIAVGDRTTKLASCIACTFFMYATGYPPTSIHLGRSDSWAPLYEPYSPLDMTPGWEREIVRDLNTAWYDRCHEFVRAGLLIMTEKVVAASHWPSRNRVEAYLNQNPDSTVAATLILDAIAINGQHGDRLDRTLVGPT